MSYLRSAMIPLLGVILGISVGVVFRLHRADEAVKVEVFKSISICKSLCSDHVIEVSFHNGGDLASCTCDINYPAP